MGKILTTAAWSLVADISHTGLEEAVVWLNSANAPKRGVAWKSARPHQAAAGSASTSIVSNTFPAPCTATVLLSCWLAKTTSDWLMTNAGKKGTEAAGALPWLCSPRREATSSTEVSTVLRASRTSSD